MRVDPIARVVENENPSPPVLAAQRLFTKLASSRIIKDKGGINMKLILKFNDVPETQLDKFDKVTKAVGFLFMRRYSLRAFADTMYLIQ